MATVKPYRAERGAPPTPPGEGAPGLMTRKQRMGKMNIDPEGRLTDEDLRTLNPVLEPVPGEEVGMRKEKRKTEVYTKKLASGGSASKRADGCAQRGKTRGKMV